MAGRTAFMADKALSLYKGLQASPASATWCGLFTTNPTADHPTAHGGVEWGPARVRVFPNSGAGSPYWSDPADEDSFIRYITNVGSVLWSSITLTTSPSTVRGVGVWDAQTSGRLLTWYQLVEEIIVADGEDRLFGSGTLKIRGD